MRFLLLPLIPIIAVAEVVALVIEIPLGTSGSVSNALDKLGAKITNEIAGKTVIDIDTNYETKGEGE